MLYSLILKSLVIPAIWPTLSSVIYSRITLVYFLLQIKDILNHVVHVINQVISVLNCTIFAQYRIISITKWDVKTFLFPLYNKPLIYKILNSFQALLLLVFTVFKPFSDWLVIITNHLCGRLIDIIHTYIHTYIHHTYIHTPPWRHAQQETMSLSPFWSSLIRGSLLTRNTTASQRGRQDMNKSLLSWLMLMT